VTLIAQNSGMRRLDIIGSGTVPYDGYMDGDWNTPRQMVQRVHDSIAAAEMEAGIHVQEIYVGVPGEFMHVRSCEAEIDVPEGVIDENAVNAVMDAAAEQLELEDSGCLVLHRSPAWYMVDDGKRTMRPEGNGSRLKASVSFIVAEPVFIEDISEMMGVLGVTILGFLSSTLGEALLLPSLDERDRGVMLIDCGYLNTEISVVEGDAITYHAIIPQGGGHMTAALAEQLNIPMKTAEQIKRDYVFNPDDMDKDTFSEVSDEAGTRVTVPREVVSECLEANMNELTHMIDLTIRNDAGRYLGARSQIYLTGGGIAMMRGAKENLSAGIGRPVKLAAAKTSELNSPVYASSLGLADLAFDSVEQVKQEEGSPLSKVKGFFRGRQA
ncbi:MAG: rod shape-determining protein, partial [Clostridia bacterium]|nr:rod shape-determining protein [Clostridia bacterium]